MKSPHSLTNSDILGSIGRLSSTSPEAAMSYLSLTNLKGASSALAGRNGFRGAVVFSSANPQLSGAAELCKIFFQQTVVTIIAGLVVAAVLR